MSNDTVQKLRQRRIANSIPLIAVARKANIERSRASLLENGHVIPKADELKRLAAALDELIAIRQAAIAAGWPAAAI